LNLVVAVIAFKLTLWGFAVACCNRIAAADSEFSSVTFRRNQNLQNIIRKTGQRKQKKQRKQRRMKANEKAC
jgi:hypothetical protein